MKTINHKKGFSLLELIVTVTFLSIIAFGIIRLETSNISIGNTQNRQTQANNLAHQGIEIAEAMGKTTLQSLCPQKCKKSIIKSGNNYTLGNQEEVIDGIFTRMLGIEPIGIEDAQIKIGTTPSLALRVTAEVTWQDTNGEHNLKVKRVIYE